MEGDVEVLGGVGAFGGVFGGREDVGGEVGLGGAGFGGGLIGGGAWFGIAVSSARGWSRWEQVAQRACLDGGGDRVDGQEHGQGLAVQQTLAHALDWDEA